MAIGRLSMKVGKVGKAGPHAAYIAREGKYAARRDRSEKLEATESGNMPAWAQHCPQEFWKAADLYERKNGTTYREMEIALPRELSAEQRAELVRDFVREEIGGRHAYQWAIHSPRAADGGEQPHVHLMFSERQRDCIERDPEQYFKRYNGKNPALGGARKGYGPSAGVTLSAAERKTELRHLRDRWEKACNAHLGRAGLTDRIDMRSHIDRNTGLMPERKHLPSEWREPALRAKIIDFRQARAELSRSRRVLMREIPNAGAEIVSIEAERERRFAERNSSDVTHRTGPAAVQGREHSEMVKSTKSASLTKKELAERVSIEEAARVATALSRQNEMRENQVTMRQQGKGRDAEKAAQDLREQNERTEQEQAAREQQRRMEQERHDELDRLVNQLQREHGQNAVSRSTAIDQMKASGAQRKHSNQHAQGYGQNVVRMDQMRAQAVERGYLNDRLQEGDQAPADVRTSLVHMREQAEKRREAKEQERDEPDMGG